MSTMAVGAIGVYRHYLSPLKGFRCAHAALHHRGTCSDFGLRVYGRHAFSKATAMLRRRFAECRSAYRVLMATAPAVDQKPEQDGKRKAGTRSDCDPLSGVDCCSADPSCIEVGACDCLGGF